MIDLTTVTVTEVIMTIIVCAGVYTAIEMIFKNWKNKNL